MSDERTTTRRLTRRQMLRTGAAAGAAAAAPAALAGVGSAQVTTEMVIPSSAPTLGKDDYTGILVQVSAYEGNVPDAVQGCQFLVGENTDSGDSTEQQIVSYVGHIIRQSGGERRQSGEVSMYAAVGNTTVEPGKLFIVNNQQQACGDAGFVGLSVEEVGASDIDAQTEQTTGGSIPGFGPLAALAAIGAGAAGLARRGD